MDLAIEDRFLERLPFFPLPGLVFFPNTLLPLHIFEPRYRAMTAYCLETGSPLAVTCIKPGHEAEQPGDPPVETVCGVGRFLRHSRTSDGRYHLLLEGIARVRIVEELEKTLPFRVARAEMMLDRKSVGDVEERVEVLRTMIGNLQYRFPAVSEALDSVARVQASMALVDGLAGMLLSDMDERQSYLECVWPDRRVSMVEIKVMTLLAPKGGIPDA